MEKVTLTIDGMMCGMCESHICDAIRKNFEVKKVTASHKKKEAVVLTDLPLPKAQMKKVLGALGYTLVDMRSEPYALKTGLNRLFGK